MLYKFKLFLLIVSIAGLTSCEKPEIYVSKDEPIDSLILLIPNAFTPNHDGRNEKYKVVYEYGSFRTDSPALFLKAKNIPIKKFEMEVRDQDNIILFSTSNINDGWDGEFNDKSATNGIYNVYIHVEGIKKGVKNLNKQITLLR